MKISLVVTLLFSGLIYCQMPKVTSGKIEHFDNFKSSFVDARNIDVWLPDGYSEEEKYAVIYMHDGQMLFDNNITWNKQAWEVDETAGKLNAEGKTKKFIVVGIWNNGQKRHFEYFPQKAFRKLSAEEKEFVSNKFEGMNFVVSGVFSTFSRDELKKVIEDNGGKNVSSISAKTTYVVAGENMGPAKLEKATKLGVVILSEVQFIALLS
jgi:NAD-dependent DNA ligase